MELTFLGTGTSHGIPVIGCNCRVCKSKNKKNKRYRTSAFISTNNNTKILIDISPEFRLQAIENKISNIDCVLLTHSHADHLHGIDDLRIFSCAISKDKKGITNPNDIKFNKPPIPIYTNNNTCEDLRNRFSYLFNPVKEGGGHAKIDLQSVEKQFLYNNIEITPVPMMHGSMQTCGWIISEQDSQYKKSIAYLTDCNFISEQSINLIKKTAPTLTHLIIDGLRITPHSTHFSFLEAMETANKLNAEHIWITHITHATSHKDVINYLNQNKINFPNLKKAKTILPAYDGLKIKC